MFRNNQDIWLKGAHWCWMPNTYDYWDPICRSTYFLHNIRYIQAYNIYARIYIYNIGYSGIDHSRSCRYHYLHIKKKSIFLFHHHRHLLYAHILVSFHFLYFRFSFAYSILVLCIGRCFFFLFCMQYLYTALIRSWRRGVALLFDFATRQRSLAARLFFIQFVMAWRQQMRRIQQGYIILCPR